MTTNVFIKYQRLNIRARLISRDEEENKRQFSLIDQKTSR